MELQFLSCCCLSELFMLGPWIFTLYWTNYIDQPNTTHLTFTWNWQYKLTKHSINTNINEASNMVSLDTCSIKWNQCMMSTTTCILICKNTNHKHIHNSMQTVIEVFDIVLYLQAFNNHVKLGGCPPINPKGHFLKCHFFLGLIRGHLDLSIYLGMV